MLTFEKVLEIFEDFLKEDQDIEILKASRGYVHIQWAVAWDDNEECIGYDDCQTVHTPEALFEKLLADVEMDTEFNLTKGRRELTAEDEKMIQKACQVYLERRRDEESK